MPCQKLFPRKNIANCLLHQGILLSKALKLGFSISLILVFTNKVKSVIRFAGMTPFYSSLKTARYPGFSKLMPP
jgi:hypothetical protein